MCKKAGADYRASRAGKDTSHGTKIRYGQHEDIGDAIMNLSTMAVRVHPKHNKRPRGVPDSVFERSSFDPDKARQRAAANI